MNNNLKRCQIIFEIAYHIITIIVIIYSAFVLNNFISYVFNENISRIFSEENDKDNSSISCSFMIIHNEILELRKDSWHNNNYKKLISRLETDNEKLLNKIVGCLQEMANLTFAKDKILDKHTI